MGILPANWSDLEQRLGYVFGGGDAGAATAREILVQMVAARFSAGSLRELDRVRRQVAFQKACGITIALEDLDGDLAFYRDGVRELVRRIVGRFCDGYTIEGPEWRLDPSETDRVTYEQLVADADFASVASHT